MSPPASPAAVSRRARILIGVVFLAAAAGWAVFALRRNPQPVGQTVRVHVVDLAGAPVPGAQVRTRYGGEWVAADKRGEAALASPRVKQGLAEVDALVDALEARATFHAMRHGRRAEVVRAADGALDATFRLEHCGLLRLAVAMTAHADAKATLDPDPARERWRLAEGSEVVRAGQAATFAVFPGAERLWVTLEGLQGVAQHRIAIPAPGPGFLLEKTLFPGPARPIAGLVTTRAAAAPMAATLAGVLEVEELAEGGVRQPRGAVRIEPDGAFSVDFTGENQRFALRPYCAFAATPEEVVVESGTVDVRIDATPLPWIEVGPADLGRMNPLPNVALFARGASLDVLPENGVFATEQGLRVATPGAGAYVLSVAARGSTESPPRSGEAQVTVPEAGPVSVQVALADLPHGRLSLALDAVPAGGGEVRVLPDRVRTVLALPKDGQVPFAHLPVGRAFVAAHWRDANVARSFAVAEIADGATATVKLAVQRGGRVEWDVTGTLVEDEPRAWALHIPAKTTPYGEAEGTLPLARRWTGGALILATDAALLPGAYRAELHSTVPGAGPGLQVTFEVRADEVTRVRVKTP